MKDIFDEVNYFVFDTDRHFEELQSKCLELATDLLNREEEIQRLREELDKYKTGPRYQKMPQTPEQFASLAEKYEKALLRKEAENSKLRERINVLQQKTSKA